MDDREPTPSGESGGEVRDRVDHLFRQQAGQMVSTLTRIFGIGHLDLVEDVVQEALLRALRTWPYHGIPDRPAAWIVRVARNRALDALRRQAAWGEKEELLERSALVERASALEADVIPAELLDDQLAMMFACCHPALSRDAQVALTLKTVGAFSVPEIARAFLTTEATIAQRIVRAKRKLKDVGARVEIPGESELPARLYAVLEVLYLMFNEGYGASEGEDLVRRDLCQEALRLALFLSERPATEDAATHALSALFCFLASRVGARADSAGEFVTLQEQDRTLWDRELLAAGAHHMARSAGGDLISAYHFEAEIAACHSMSPSFRDTDWERIAQCYDALLDLNPSPVVAVNRLVAVWQARGAEAAWTEGAAVFSDAALANYPHAHAIRAELLAELGCTEEAREALGTALELITSEPVRRFLERKRAALQEALRYE